MALIKYSADLVLNDTSVFQEFINTNADAIADLESAMASGGGDTYTLSATDGTNEVTINLDANSGTDSSFKIKQGTGITVNVDSAGDITIASVSGSDDGNYVTVDTTSGEITDGSNTFQYLYRYLHVRFSASSNGASFTTNPANIAASNTAIYIGTANRSTTTALTNATDYTWTEYTWGSGRNVFYRKTGGNRIEFLTSTQSAISNAVQFVDGDSPLDFNTLEINTGNIVDNAVATDKIQDDAISSLKLADDAVTNAKIAARAVGSDETQLAIPGSAIFAGVWTDGTNNGPSADGQLYCFSDVSNLTRLENSGAWADLEAIRIYHTDGSGKDFRSILDGSPSDVVVAMYEITSANRPQRGATFTATVGALVSANFFEITLTDPREVVSFYSRNKDYYFVLYPNVTSYFHGNVIVDGTVSATQIATDAITADKISANAITTAKINADAVTTAKIAADAITATEIAADAVTTAKIAADAITSTEIAADAITTSKIAADAVTTAKIAADAVTATEISVDDLSAINADLGAITAGSLQGGSVPDANAAPSGTEAGAFLDLDNGKFTFGDATNNILYDGTNFTINGSIITDNNINGVLSIGKMPDGAKNSNVTKASLSLNNVYYQAAVPTTDVRAGDLWYDTDDSNKLYVAAADGSDAIADGEWELVTFGNANLAANSVTASTIAATTITSAELASDSVIAAKIASAAVTTDKLQANAVTAAKIAAGTITASEIDSTSVLANTVQVGAASTTTNYAASSTTFTNYDTFSGLPSDGWGMRTGYLSTTDVDFSTWEDMQGYWLGVDPSADAPAAYGEHLVGQNITLTIGTASATFEVLDFYLSVSDYEWLLGVPTNTTGTPSKTTMTMSTPAFSVTTDGPPSVSGTMVSGVGGLIKSDGDFFVGDADSTYLFYDNSADSLTMSGVTLTGSTVSYESQDATSATAASLDTSGGLSDNRWDIRDSDSAGGGTSQVSGTTAWSAWVGDWLHADISSANLPDSWNNGILESAVAYGFRVEVSLSDGTATNKATYILDDYDDSASDEIFKLGSVVSSAGSPVTSGELTIEVSAHEYKSVAASVSGANVSGKGYAIYPSGDFFVGDADNEYIFFDESAGTLNINADLAANSLSATSEASAPTISGTTVTGKGVLAKSDGDFFAGDADSSHIFFDQSEDSLSVVGDVSSGGISYPFTVSSTVFNPSTRVITGDVDANEWDIRTNSDDTGISVNASSWEDLAGLWIISGTKIAQSTGDRRLKVYFGSSTTDFGLFEYISGTFGSGPATYGAQLGALVQSTGTPDGDNTTVKVETYSFSSTSGIGSGYLLSDVGEAFFSSLYSHSETFNKLHLQSESSSLNLSRVPKPRFHLIDYQELYNQAGYTVVSPSGLPNWIGDDPNTHHNHVLVVGDGAAEDLYYGSGHVVVGYNALGDTRLGDLNTAVGHQAGSKDATTGLSQATSGNVTFSTKATGTLDNGEWDLRTDRFSSSGSVSYSSWDDWGGEYLILGYSNNSVSYLNNLLFAEELVLVTITSGTSTATFPVEYVFEDDDNFSLRLRAPTSSSGTPASSGSITFNLAAYTYRPQGHNRCTFIGAESGASYTAALDNCSSLGYNAISSLSGNNQVAIGNTSVTSIKGQVSFGTYSDKRDKTDIEDSTFGLEFINSVNARTFHQNPRERYESEKQKTNSDGDLLYIQPDGTEGTTETNKPSMEIVFDQSSYDDATEKNSLPTIGFIAQEMQAALDAASPDQDYDFVDDEETKKNIKYADLTAILWKGMQEISAKLDAVKDAVDDADNTTVAQLKSAISSALDT